MNYLSPDGAGAVDGFLTTRRIGALKSKEDFT
jgi:hypothetical protein